MTKIEYNGDIRKLRDLGIIGVVTYDLETGYTILSFNGGIRNLEGVKSITFDEERGEIEFCYEGYSIMQLAKKGISI